MKRSIYIMFVCLGALVACGKNSINKTLDHVENIVVRQPDSALILLDSIKYTIKSGEEQARYILFTLYAKDLSGEDISKDSSIIYARDYMKTTINPKYLALSEYYLGRIYQAQGKNEQALQFYLEAKTNAENTDNNNLKGLINSYIGKQYYYQQEWDNAITNFKSALKYFNESPDNYKRQIAALNDIANCFLLKKVKDSAMICYTEALQLARTAQDSAAIKHNLGVMYLAINETRMAKQQLFQALNLNSDSTLLNLIYMNLSKVYEREQTIDSAVYFAKLSILLGEKRNDLYSLYANYKILARLEEKNGNYQNAMNYYKKGFTSYTKIQTKNTVDIQGIETKHELNMLKNKHRYCMRAIRLACLALVIIAFFLIRYIRKNKLKSAQRQSEMNEREERINNELTKIKQELIAKDNCINKIQDEMNEKEKFVKLYLDTLMALHKKLEQSLSDLSILSDENKKHAEKVINSLLSVFSTNNTWKMIYNAGKSTFDEIRKQYPELSEQEFKIVCLDVLNYSNAMIADITGMKQTTIQKQKSDLRKKLNIEDGGKISSCIRSQVG